MQLHEKPGQTNTTGAIGEAIACQFLQQQGFTLIDQNYYKKWGEIDLIMQHAATVHFVEVKSVSYSTRAQMRTAQRSGPRPEEQMTRDKYRKLTRVIDTWLQQERYKGQYQLDLVTVYLVPAETYAQVEYFARIVVE